MLAANSSRVKIIRLIFWLSFLSLAGGCATYQKSVQEAKRHLASQEFAKASSVFEAEANVEGDSQLAYLLDYATVLQAAGRYQESSRAFILADKMSEVKDYHSLSRISGSLLLNEGLVQYKGEDFEKVLINAFSAINFVMLNNLESALVEARRLNDKLYKYKYEAKMNYEQDTFAMYLSGAIWEAARKWDDAYIEYHRAYQVNPNIVGLKEDMFRVARLAQRTSDLEKHKAEFASFKFKPEWTNPQYGEIILIYQQGWGPQKRPHPENQSIPWLYPVRSTTTQAQLLVGNLEAIESRIVSNVEKSALATFQEAYGELVAKRIAGLAAKAVVSHQIRQKDEGLGNLAWVLMNVADQADLRQWGLLPQTFQVARVYVKAGKHRVRVQGINWSGQPTGEEMQEVEIEVKPRQKKFLLWRSYK